jgi:hypothetical protein
MQHDKNFCTTIVAQNRIEQSLQSLGTINRSNRLNRAVVDWGTPQKPQIVSVPGVPVKERHRYRVTLNGELLGDRLTSHEALKLAGGKR